MLAAAAGFEGVSLLRATGQIRSEAAEAHRRPLQHVKISADPALKVVASEDAIAVAGLALAAAGVVLHQVTGHRYWEGVASAAIGVLLICAAVALARDSMSLLIGESVDPDLVKAIDKEVSGHPMVDHLVESLTRYLGAHEVMVAVRVELVHGLTSDDIEQMSCEIDTRLRALSPEITQVFVDATTSHERRRLEPARRTGETPRSGSLGVAEATRPSWLVGMELIQSFRTKARTEGAQGPFVRPPGGHGRNREPVQRRRSRGHPACGSRSAGWARWCTR